MHGTYTHRITCNLHPHQYFPLKYAAQKFNARLAPFVRDAALAYVQKRTLLPPDLQRKLLAIRHEVRRVGTTLNEIATRANSIERVTHGDLRRAGELVLVLDRQVTVLHHTISTLPLPSESVPSDHGDQVNGS